MQLKSVMSNQLYTWRKVGVKCARLGSDKNGGDDEQQGNNNGNRFINKLYIMYITFKVPERRMDIE